MAKTTAQKVRSNDQKDFARVFDSLASSYSRWSAWTDFITLSAICISNAVDKEQFEDREKTFKQIMSKYRMAERERFAELLALVVDGMENNPDQDYLGELYMAMELGNQQAGQFFTPYYVCRAMAQITLHDGIEEQVDRRGYITVNDCACGAGATLIAAANELKRMGINYQTQALFVAQDVDQVVAMMCYIQLSLLGCAGYVIVGNSLSSPGLQPGNSVWYTPMYCCHPGWKFRRAMEKLKA